MRRRHQRRRGRVLDLERRLAVLGALGSAGAAAVEVAEAVVVHDTLQHRRRETEESRRRGKMR
jgi:hypothetical protein